MADYRRYKVWHKAHDLALAIYRATHSFPSGERFELTSQLRRAAASIPSNIAEGVGRASDRDRARFVDYAIGSAHEVHYQLLLSRDLHYIEPAAHADLESKVVEVRRMLSSLHRKLTTSS